MQSPVLKSETEFCEEFPLWSIYFFTYINNVIYDKKTHMHPQG